MCGEEILKEGNLKNKLTERKQMMSFSDTAGGLLGNFGPQPSYSFRSCQEAIVRRLKGKGAKRESLAERPH